MQLFTKVSKKVDFNFDTGMEKEIIMRYLLSRFSISYLPILPSL